MFEAIIAKNVNKKHTTKKKKKEIEEREKKSNRASRNRSSVIFMLATLARLLDHPLPTTVPTGCALGYVDWYVKVNVMFLNVFISTQFIMVRLSIPSIAKNSARFYIIMRF